MPTFATTQFDYEFHNAVASPQNCMVAQQRQQISELQLNKFPTLQSFLVWIIRFKNQVTTCSDFSIGCCVVDQFFGRVVILAISLWKGLSKLRDVRREDCLCSEQDHREFPVQEEGQPRGAEKPKKRTCFYEEDRSPS